MNDNEVVRSPWYREITWEQWKALIAGWAVWALDAVDFLLLTYVLTDVARTFHVPLATASLLILATYAVRWIGGLGVGHLSDRIGRKLPILITIGWYTVFAVLTGISWNFTALVIFRLLLGIGMAPGFSLGATLVAETWPERHRAIGIAIQDSGWGAGGILASVIYLFLFPEIGWRGLFFVGLVPAAFLMLFVSVAVRESPVWQQRAAQHQLVTAPAKELFTRHTGRVAFLFVLMLFLFFSNWPMLGLFPTYLKSLHLSTGLIGGLGLTVSIGEVCGFALSGFLASWLGRRRALGGMLIVGAIMTILLVMSIHVLLLAAVMAFLSGAFLVGAAGIWGAILAENLPTNVRASGMGFLYNIGSVGGGLAPYVVLTSLRVFRVSFGTGLAAVSVLAVLIACALLLFARETKGISLETLDQEDCPGLAAGAEQAEITNT